MEYGSPKVPQFAEAMLLHQLDNLDSKMECMRSLVDNDRHVEGCWTSYSSSLDRTVLKKKKYLGEEPAQSVAAETAAAAEAAPADTKPPVPPPQCTPAQPSTPAVQPHNAPESFFAEKLREAWRKDS